jgi:hypothetical protein
MKALKGGLRVFVPLLLAGLPSLAAEKPVDIRFVPLVLESTTLFPYRHRMEVRADFGFDRFEESRGTSTLSGLFTRAAPSLEYRYTPSPSAEILLRLPYVAQGVELSPKPGGARLETRNAAGVGQPLIAIKTLFSPRLGIVLSVSPPSAPTAEDPPVAEGSRFGGQVIARTGRWHWGAGHTARLEYAVHGATGTQRWNPGDTSTFSIARTSSDNPRYAKKDYVGTVFELHGIYRDRDRVNGRAVPDSASLSGRAVFGFDLGHVNSRTAHVTRMGVSAGFGDTIHKTLDPMEGLADAQLLVGYLYLWGKGP